MGEAEGGETRREEEGRHAAEMPARLAEAPGGRRHGRGQRAQPEPAMVERRRPDSAVHAYVVQCDSPSPKAADQNEQSWSLYSA